MSTGSRRPTVRLHDVSVDGDTDNDAALAAVERAVAESLSGGTTSREAVRSAVARCVSESRQP